MNVYCRQRFLDSRAFIEFYVCFENNKLCFPTKSIERFNGRILLTGQVPVTKIGYNLSQEVGTSAQTLTIHATNSTPANVTKTTLENVEKDGLWISQQDTIPRGRIFSEDQSNLVNAKAAVFGIEIDSTLHQLLYFGLFDIYKLLNPVWPQTSISNEPYVMYHGTSRSSVKSILTNGLKPTDGMFGNAIYFGSFWKAFRFATMTQKYVKRDGAIFRCYFYSSRVPHIRTLCDRCCCDVCKVEPKKKKAKKDSFNSNNRIADHLGLWQQTSDIIMCFSEPGGPIKNEEYAIKNNTNLTIDSIAHVVCQTEVHEPLNRALKIM